jgi:arylsulfatase A-like enzyme
VAAAHRAAEGAPNVLLIMTDDQGFGAPSTFGGVIPTPAMDRIAKEGCATRTSIRRRSARRRGRR